MTDLTQQNSSTDDFINDLGGAYPYEAASPIKRDFKPWHKPRKQYIRDKQWMLLIDELLTKYLPNDKIVKYLSLPGDDLLDLRQIHDKICAPKSLKIKYLGFNTGEKPGPEHDAALEISRAEINKLPFVDDQSALLPDDIVQISSEKSMAHNYSKQMGPFDVINIDLCDSIAKQGVEEFAENHYKTLNALITMQAFRKEPWLLLLTTRADKKRVNPEVFEILKGIYLNNLTSCDGFLRKSSAVTTVDSKESLDKYCAQDGGYSNVFLMGLSKWIQTLGVAQMPQKTVEIKSILGYKVESKATAPDMISIALEISPTASLTPDRVGLSKSHVTQVDECEKAIDMLEQLSKQDNVDEILFRDSNLYHAMLTETSELLKQARYDVTGYATWAQKQSQKATAGLVALDLSQSQAPSNPPNDTVNSGIFSNKQKLMGPKIVEKLDPETWERYTKRKK